MLADLGTDMMTCEEVSSVWVSSSGMASGLESLSVILPVNDR